VQRTGWGKSAVYFAATALLRARGAGPTVIVSPLLALMRNQIAAAAKAGIGPGMKIVAVNGRKFSPDVWNDAIRAAKTSPSPIELIVENTDYFRVVKLDYHQGEKFPHLVRDDSKPDLLTDIIRPR